MNRLDAVLGLAQCNDATGTASGSLFRGCNLARLAVVERSDQLIHICQDVTWPSSSF